MRSKRAISKAGQATGLRNIAAEMIGRADTARDARQFERAAILYEEAATLQPGRVDLLVQAGHMLKEAGDLAGAERHYSEAALSMPADADLAMQCGHLFKLQGRLAEAADAYRRASLLRPRWDDPARELKALGRSGWQDPRLPISRAVAAAGPYGMRRGDDLAPIPDLAPGSPLDALHAHGEELAVRSLGKREYTPWGLMPVMRGVRSFRGFCIALVPILLIEIHISGQLVYRGAPSGAFTIPHERDNPGIRRYTFNVWIDLTHFVESRYEVTIRAIDAQGRALTRVDPIVIARPIPPSALPDSDTNVPSADPADPRSLDDQINSRPSLIRPARRALLKEAPRTILVQRPDVLGDLVVAIPALQQLRVMFPAAKIVGMLSPGNVELARTLPFFDEIIVTELAFNPWERRRVVTAEAQKKLAADLARYQFDLAIDLGTSPDSRLLLSLAGSPVTVGFRCDQYPQLTVEVTGGTKDPWNGHENVPHTNMALGLMAWLGAMMRSEPTLLRRDDLAPTLLRSFGLAPDARFVVLHAGGRWAFSRWPHYIALAEMLIAQTDLHVVFLTTDTVDEATLPEGLATSRRFQVLSRRLSFDELDGLLSFCSTFVGDDSGVKHLASLRGAQVIGIQNARNNWSEWGQDNGGYIVTRKVPCAGCLIQNYPESDECGRDFVCIKAIKPEEIFSTVLTMTDGAERGSSDRLG